MVRIVICDDEKDCLEKTQKEILKAANNLNFETDIHIFTDGNEAIDFVCSKEEKTDILFLDIDMPVISGLAVAEKIRSVQSDMILIFISAHEQYVFQSLDYQPFQYIRKGNMEVEIEIVLKRAYKKIMSENTKSAVFKTEDGEVRLKYTDIMYFEMESRKVNIYTKDERRIEIAERITIKQIYNQVKDMDFVLIHSGCIVNVQYIQGYSDYDITLDTNQRLIVSRRRLKEVKEVFSRYWRNRI